jgi:hypothetical protein
MLRKEATAMLYPIGVRHQEQQLRQLWENLRGTLQDAEPSTLRLDGETPDREGGVPYRPGDDTDEGVNDLLTEVASIANDTARSERERVSAIQKILARARERGPNRRVMMLLRRNENL